MRAPTYAAASPYPERDDPDPSAFELSVRSTLTSVLGQRRMSRRRINRLVHAVDRAAEICLSNDGDLRQAAELLRPALLANGFALEPVASAFALVREASHRHLGLRHHPVQLAGGWVMLKGQLAEMQTGEGKTITALLSAATAALMGVPVHVITVNDYLAKRDAETLQPVYEALGLTVGLVQPGQDPEARRLAYAQNVTYCTNKDVAFDYLRDRIALGRRRGRSRLLVDALMGAEGREPLLMRGLHFAIVDEADSVLIDEARTPLILSGHSDEPDEADRYNQSLTIAQHLTPGTHFQLRVAERQVTLTPEGEAQLATRTAGQTGLLAARRARHELVEQALAALHLYERDKHYIVADEKVQIVDEATGRVMSDRSWERGLHQLIEVKEGCAISGRRRTLARITYQRFFRRYLNLGGMSGTLREAHAELGAVYGRSVVAIPPHRTSRRQDKGARYYRSATDRWQAVVASVQSQSVLGRPVLIGTRSVAASEHLSGLLHAAGLAHRVLNARHDALEAEIVAQAGGAGRITVATNMAGRGTDIHLDDGVRAAGGLHVILSEFHESARVDRQLFGRCGRQGDPGTHEAIVSLVDDLFTRSATQPWQRLIKGPGPHVHSLWGSALTRLAQQRAEREYARTRRQTMLQDCRLEQALAFAGQGE